VVRPRWIYPTTILVGGALIGSLSVLTSSGTLLPPASPAAAGLDFAACATPAHVDVVASPRIYDVVVAAATKAGASSCTSISVMSEEAVVTANALAAGVGPDLWIPDSTMWATDVNSRGRGEVQQGPSLATSPLVVAVPSSLSVTKATWTQLVDGGVPMRIADPVSNTSGRLAIVAARKALGGDRAMGGPLGAGLVELSRTAATSDSALLDELIMSPTAAPAFPVEEATLLAYEKAHPSVRVSAVVPSDGTARFDYPLLTRAGSSASVTRAATALTTTMLSPEMRTRIREAGLRTSITEAIPNPLGTVTVAPAYASLPSADETKAIFNEWTSAQTDARMLVVMDTSGSMARAAGATTRMELAKDAADTALANVPDTSQMGLWTFSSSQRGKIDYREVVPMRGLADPVAAQTQRQALSAGFAEAARSVKGDTGLYDTIAAAYAQLQDTYDPTLVNTLVVITDGTNDDPDGGLSLAQLVARIRAGDPSKPISVALVGITKDADVKALRTIAKATDGRVYLADRPSSIKAVLVDALLSRRA
jgi:Mg-chelatase subunit ChlD